MAVLRKHLIALILCWTVSGVPLRTIDGDTFVAEFEIWPKLRAIETVRLLAVDTPEMRGDDRERALAAKDFTERWLARGAFQIETCRRDAFGRLLAHVFRNGSSLADELEKEGLLK